MKKCKTCNLLKSIEQFYNNAFYADGKELSCKNCRKKNVKAAYYRNHDARMMYEKIRNQTPERKLQLLASQKKRRSIFPGKYLARTAVNNAIRDGRLKRLPCEICGKKAQAHHDDYRKKLDVRWLCFKHHREIEHAQIVN